MTKPRKNIHSHGIPFDPLQYVKRLESVGFTREQAEAQAETFLTIVQEQLVTKQDLKEVEMGLTQQIKELESKTTLEIALLKRDLKIWFGGMLVTLIIVLSTLQTLIAHFISH